MGVAAPRRRTNELAALRARAGRLTNSEVRHSQGKCCTVICALSEVCNGTVGRYGNGAGMATQHAAHRAAAYERGPTMKFKSNTYGDIYGPAMSLTTREQADDWWESAVENLVTRGVSREEVADLVSQNLGYWTGYCDAVTAQRVFALFAHRNVSHPIFGKRRDVTPKEAFEAGRKMAAK